MTIYVVFIIIILMLGLLLYLDKNYRNKTTYLKVVFLLMIIIVALRGTQVGIDTLTYNRFYDEFKTLSFAQIFSADYDYSYNMERTWAVLNHVIGNTLGNFQFVLLFAATVYFVGAYFYLKDSEKTGVLVVVTFIYNGLFIQSMNLTRQYTAMGLCMIGWHLFREEKKWRGLICLIIAFLSHRSSIIFIPFILLSLNQNFKLTRKITILGVVGAILGVYFYDQILPIVFSYGKLGWYSKYANSYKESGVGLTRYIWLVELLTTILIYLYNRKNELEKGKKSGNEVRMLMVIIYFVLCTLSARFLLLARIGRYFQIATLGIYDDFCEIIRKKHGYSVYAFSVVMLILGLSCIFLVSIYSNLEQYSYMFFWQ